VEAALDELGAPDLAVNNAGIVRFGPLIDLSATDFEAVVRVNLVGTFTVARAAARRMLAAGVAGSIVNVTSMNGVAPGPNGGAYGASKAAIALLTQQMAVEWGPLGLRVNAVAPGLILAGMSDPIYADPEVRAAREGKVPLGRLGTAEDIANVVAFLASDEAAYITGQNVLVDGGVTMSIIANLPRPKSVDKVGMQ
jgi:NAD(P)-dependent dehydrogenase (short-subunit alcohol dehydrogenase family)